MAGDAGTGGARKCAREIPVDLQCSRFLVAVAGVCGGRCPVTPIHRQQRSVPDDGVRQAVVARLTRGSDRLSHGLIGCRLISVDQVREGKHPEREVAPATASRFQGDRLRGIGQHDLWTGAAHRGPEDGATRLERRGAVRWTTGERPAFGDVREMLCGSHVACRELLPRPQDREPRAFFELVVTELPDPRSRRRAAAGPVVSNEAGAHQRGGEVEVTGREGMTHRRIEVPGLLVPPRRSTVQPASSSRLTRLELILQEFP